MTLNQSKLKAIILGNVAAMICGVVLALPSTAVAGKFHCYPVDGPIIVSKIKALPGYSPGSLAAMINVLATSRTHEACTKAFAELAAYKRSLE